MALTFLAASPDAVAGRVKFREGQYKRVAIVQGYSEWQGSHDAYLSKVGVGKSTLGKWSLSFRRTGSAVPRPSQVPRLVEVFTLPPQSAQLESAPLARIERSRLSFPAGVTMELDGLPPAAWVAELVAGLRRC
jgi:hypothetical protein